MVPVDYLFRKNDSHCCVHYYCGNKMSVGKMFFDRKTWRNSLTLRMIKREAFD